MVRARRLVRASGLGHESSQGLRPGRLARLAWLPIPLLLAAIIVARAAGLTRILHVRSPEARLERHLLHARLDRHPLSHRTQFPGVRHAGAAAFGVRGDPLEPGRHGRGRRLPRRCQCQCHHLQYRHLPGGTLPSGGRHPLAAAAAGASRSAPVAGGGLRTRLGRLWLVAHAALASWLPVFFIPGHGGTLVRYCVLISAIAMFVLSAGLLLAGQREARAPFTSWYALAMLLLAVGLFGIMIQLSFGSVVNWLARTAQWLGGLYLLFAAVAALRESDLPLFLAGREVASGALPATGWP